MHLAVHNPSPLPLHFRKQPDSLQRIPGNSTPRISAYTKLTKTKTSGCSKSSISPSSRPSLPRYHPIPTPPLPPPCPSISPKSPAPAPPTKSASPTAVSCAYKFTAPSPSTALSSSRQQKSPGQKCGPSPPPSCPSSNRTCRPSTMRWKGWPTGPRPRSWISWPSM